MIGLAVALIHLPVVLRAASLRAELDRSTIALGQSATLSLVFEGAAPDQHPSLPQISNLMIRPAGQSSQYQFVNGSQSVSYTFTYQLIPRQEGQYVIPPVEVVVGRERLSSRQVILKVLPQGSTGAGPASDERAKLELETSKDQVYVGELFPVTLRLYFQQARNTHMPQLEANGFVFGESPEPDQQRVSINGVPYNLITFTRWAKAVKTGELNLGPATCDTELAVSQRRRSRSVFDPFFSDPFDYRRIQLPSNTIKMKVLPLPQDNVPDSFNGAIGDFKMMVDVQPKAVAVGDPFTVNIKIGGTGAIDSIELPTQRNWREFETYPPTSKVEYSDNLGMKGIKSFEQVLIPKNAEIKEVPPFVFSYFDPDKAQYVTLKQEAIPVKVTPSDTVQLQPTLISTNQDTQRPKRVRDIIHIKTRPGTLAQISPPLIQRPWFVLIQCTPVALWLMALFRRKYKERLQNNPRLVRQREVEKLEREGLAELRRLSAERQSDEFIAQVFRLLQERIGERLDLPASAITEEVLDDKLKSRGTSEETLARLHQLFQLCDQARFAPLETEQAFSEVLPEVEIALQELKQLPG